MLYNGGKDNDFIAIELIQGHLHYTYNMGWFSLKIIDDTDDNGDDDDDDN